jgi:ABC-2 type transport system permease protein
VNAIAAIALNTFREAIRDRILYLILAVALVLIALARFVSMLTVGSEIKIVKDLGLSAISIFGLLTTVFVGVSLVFKEIERRTIFTLLAQPVKRWQFVVGKYLGLLLVLATSVGVTGAALLAAVALSGETPWPLLPAIMLIFVELALVAAFAVLFSSFTNPILAAVGTFATYVAGHLTWSFDLLAKRMTSSTGKALCAGLHAVLPNLDRLDVKAAAVHGLALPPGTVAAAAVYGLCYAAAVVVVACAVFERREFI